MNKELLKRVGLSSLAAAVLIGAGIFNIENPTWFNEENPLYREGMFAMGTWVNLLSLFTAGLAIEKANRIKNGI